MKHKKPNCPDCGTQMEYHGKDIFAGVKGKWWKCPKCDQTCIGFKNKTLTTCSTCNISLVLLNTHYWANLQETFWQCPTCEKKYVTYQKQQKSLFKRAILEILRIAQHNSEHYITINVFGEDIYACSRCLGAYISGIIFYFIFGILYVNNIITLSFIPTFLTSFLFGSATLIDFTTVDILHIRKSNNKIRFISGILLGLSAMIYFWLLPASWLFKIITLGFYIIIALFIAYISVRMRSKKIDGKAQVSSS